MCRTRSRNRTVDFVDNGRDSNKLSDSEVLCVFDKTTIRKDNVKVICKLGGVKVRMTVDSGAAVNIISQQTYDRAMDKNIKVIKQSNNVGNNLRGYRHSDKSTLKKKL